MNKQATVDKIAALAKRRGFVYPSSEIYGGLANTWDFGHYGTLLKDNLKNWWWKQFVLDRDDMVAVDSAIFLNPKVWQASGHVAGFTDALVDCKACKHRTRADHLIEEALPGVKVEGLPVEKLTDLIKKHNLKCRNCGKKTLTDVRQFNLLFETEIGILEKSRSKTYLRGEIAQGIFLNFKNVVDTLRMTIPFGIAQQGKAFRNEITKGHFIHRTLEFDLMEFEYFIQPTNWQKTYQYWQDEMRSWALQIGIDEKNLSWREHEKQERSHYSKKTMDIEYHYPFGWQEMFGLAYRTDFDLKNHQKHSGVDLSYLDPQTGEKYIPHVVEPTFGLSRLVGVILFDAYREDKVKGKSRVYLKLNPKLSPVKLAVFPLQKDDQLAKFAKKVYQQAKKKFVAEFDDTGNIGQMYRRQDEIGTPFCVTIDYRSLEDKTVTVRERDSMKQVRVEIGKLVKYIGERIDS